MPSFAFPGSGGTFDGGTINNALLIDGSQDANQLRVKGHSTQTVDMLRVETDGGIFYLQVSSVGTVEVGPLSRKLRVSSVGTGLNGNAAVAKAAAIASPTGGITQDAESRTAIDAIRVALTNIGITA